MKREKIDIADSLQLSSHGSTPKNSKHVEETEEIIKKRGRKQRGEEWLVQKRVVPKGIQYLPLHTLHNTVLFKLFNNLSFFLQIHTRSELKAAFVEDENFLLEEYFLWLPESLHSRATLIWPPLEEREKPTKMGRNKKFQTTVILFCIAVGFFLRYHCYVFVELTK